MKSRRIGIALAAAGAVAILFATCLPSPGDVADAAATALTCLVCGDFGGVDVLLNVLLFVPFAAGLRLAGVRWRTVVAISLLFAFAIETLQYVALPGRDATLSDVLTNTMGGALGAWLAGHGRTLVAPSYRHARRLTLAAVVAWIVGASAATVLFRLDPTDRPWWGQWTAVLGMYDNFAGTLLEASVNGEPLPRTRIDDGGRLQDGVRAGRLEVTARVALAGPTRATAPIASIFDADRDEQMLLGQHGTDLVFHFRPAAANVKLERASVRLPGALAFPVGTVVTLNARLTRGVATLAVTADGSTRTDTVRLTPGTGWRLFLPAASYAFGPETVLFSALFLFALTLPVGYWSAPVGGLRWAMAFTAIAAGVLIALPTVMATAPAGAAEPLGAAAGFVAGRWLYARRPGTTPQRVPGPSVEPESSR